MFRREYTLCVDLFGSRRELMTPVTDLMCTINDLEYDYPFESVVRFDDRPEIEEIIGSIGEVDQVTIDWDFTITTGEACTANRDIKVLEDILWYWMDSLGDKPVTAEFGIT